MQRYQKTLKTKTYFVLDQNSGMFPFDLLLLTLVLRAASYAFVESWAYKNAYCTRYTHDHAAYNVVHDRFEIAQIRNKTK